MSKASIFPNIIPKVLQDEIESTLLSVKFPWFYLDDITSPTNIQKRQGFQHTFLHLDFGINSPWFYFVEEIMSHNTVETLLSAKAFLQIPLYNANKIPDLPHIDRTIDHNVSVYYVKDSDGETLLYEGDKIIQRIMPKKGTLITFNGNTMHSAIQPKTHVRCVINFNYTIEDANEI